MAESRAQLAQAEQQYPLPKNTRRKRIPKHSRALVSRFSQEILKRIFFNCIPDLMEFRHRDYRTPINLSIPFKLAAVCQRWREVALSTPQLWTNVPIAVDAANYGSVSALLPEWIRHAAGRLLSISFFYFGCDSPSLQMTTHDIIETINKHSDRFQNFIYHGPDSILSNFEGTNAVILTLDNLVLHPEMGKNSELDLRPLMLQPRHLADLLWIPPSSIHRVDWTFVTTLKLGLITVPECLQVLSNTPSVMTCQLSPYESGRGIYSDADWICIHPCMEELIILDALPLNRLLRRLKCPQLRSLTVYTEFIATYGDVPVLATFIEQSKCKLVNLTLRQVVFEGEDLKLLLPHLRFVRKLHIEEPDHADDALIHPVNQRKTLSKQLLAILSITGSCPAEPLYLPSLRSLTFHTIDEPKLKSIIKRWHPDNVYARLRPCLDKVEVASRIRGAPLIAEYVHMPIVSRRYWSLKQPKDPFNFWNLRLVGVGRTSSPVLHGPYKLLELHYSLFTLSSIHSIQLRFNFHFYLCQIVPSYLDWVVNLYLPSLIPYVNELKAVSDTFYSFVSNK